MFQVGDWVHNRIYRRHGFVFQTFGDKALKVFYPTGGFVYKSVDQWEPMTSTLDNSQIYMLMSHAVDMGDKKWFEELRQRLTEEVV